MHMYMYIHEYICTYIHLPPSEPISDERAQELIDKALESGSLEMRNIISILTGLMGSGKTWLLSRLFHQLPPGLYTSTGVAEQSFRGLLHHIGNLSMETWREFLPENILDFLSYRFREELPPANISALAAQLTTAALSESASTDLPPLPTPSTPSTSAVIPPPALPLQPRPSSPPKPSSTSQSIVKLVKAPKSSPILSMLELIHMIDTGGQPEYMEMMPHLIQSCHLAVLVLNLVFGLDDYPPINLHEKGIAYKRALPSQFTNRQLIQKLASTLQAKKYSRKKGQCFRLLVVATHKDRVKWNLSGKLEALDRELKSILLPVCNDDLILSSSSGKIAFVLNLKNPDSVDFATLELIRQKIGESGVGEIVNVPGAFLVYEQDLLKHAEEVGRDIVSIDECFKVGHRVKMNEEVVKAALIFFHRQITFLYFPSVLPNLVFLKPQTPLDVLNAVVQFSYKAKAGAFKGFPHEFTTNLSRAVITEEMLRHEYLSKCFIPKLYEPRDAIELFCHNFTIAPLSHDPQPKGQSVPGPTLREKREYLMMNLLPAISGKKLTKQIPKTPEISPLLVEFSQDCVPLSCFSSTISCLLSMYNWRLCRGADGSPECLTHNLVSLCDPQLPVQITLVDAAKYLEIHICVEKGTDKGSFPKFCFRIRETVFAAISEVFDNMQLTDIDATPAFLCSCRRVPDTHCASAFQFDSRWYLRCSKTVKNVGLVEGKQSVWLEGLVHTKARPSLVSLLQLKIHQKVSSQYREFGIFLLDDKDGNRVDSISIETECQGRPERIVRRILQEWVLGRGRPPTWQTLVKTLHDCELNVLADEIQKEKL